MMMMFLTAFKGFNCSCSAPVPFDPVTPTIDIIPIGLKAYFGCESVSEDCQRLMAFGSGLLNL